MTGVWLIPVVMVTTILSILAILVMAEFLSSTSYSFVSSEHDDDEDDDDEDDDDEDDDEEEQDEDTDDVVIEKSYVDGLEAELENLRAGCSARDEEVAEVRAEGLRTLALVAAKEDEYATLQQRYEELESDLENEAEAKRDALDDVTRLTKILQEVQSTLRGV